MALPAIAPKMLGGLFSAQFIVNIFFSVVEDANSRIIFI